MRDGGGRPRKLRPFDAFFLVLVRLRLGLFDFEHRFQIPIPTVSDIIITWINFLYVEMGSWPLWIDRSAKKANLPPMFAKVNTKIQLSLLTCTEFKGEVPKDPLKQSELYSDYKIHDTCKGLIGISPNVSVTFISQLHCGQISDRELTIKSGLCDFLEKGDMVMTDKGFDIQDILAEKEVVLFMLPKKRKGGCN